MVSPFARGRGRLQHRNPPPIIIEEEEEEVDDDGVEQGLLDDLEADAESFSDSDGGSEGLPPSPTDTEVTSSMSIPDSLPISARKRLAFP